MSILEDWARAYVKPPFGGDAVLEYRRERMWSVTWPVKREGNLVGQGLVLIQIQAPLLEELARGDANRRADIGRKTTAWLLQKLNGYRLPEGEQVPLVIDIGIEVLD